MRIPNASFGELVVKVDVPDPSDGAHHQSSDSRTSRREYCS